MYIEYNLKIEKLSKEGHLVAKDKVLIEEIHERVS
jgi:hypothetical protein